MTAESAPRPQVSAHAETGDQGHPSSGMTCGLVLHFRSAASTANCLASLHEAGIGLLVLVDNSEDRGKSLAQLGADIADLQSKGMQVVVLEPGRNLGFSAGVNRGLAAIREHFGPGRVLLINSDAQLLSGSLEPLQVCLDGGASVAAPVLQSPNGYLKRAMYYHRMTGLLSAHSFPGAFRHLSGCCLLLSDEMTQADLLDERFFFYGEDAYLGWMLLRSGRTAIVVESARVLHLGSGSSRRGSLFYEYHMARAHLELADALSKGRLDAIALRLGRYVILTLRAIWRSSRQLSLAPARGFLMAASDFRNGRICKLTPSPD